MEKLGRFLIVILLIAVLIMGGFVSWKVIESQKQTNERIEKIENKLEKTSNDTEDDKEENEKNESNDEKSQDDNGSKKVEAFSTDDLKVKGITFGSNSDEAVGVFGSDFESKSYEETASGERLIELKFKNGVVVIVQNAGEDGVVRDISIRDNSTVETARGISLKSTRSDILKAYPAASILKNDNSSVVVGYPGDNDEYSSKGRIYFNMDGDKIVSINYHNTYAE